MTMTPIQTMTIGDAGTAADVEGSPAMLAVPQPDSMIDAGLYGPLTVRAASVRGAGHRYDGTPRQDDFCLGVGGAANEWLIAVVADGVSAGPSSHIASRAAVRFATKLLNNRLGADPPDQLDWDEIVGSVAGFVLAQARNETGNQQLDAHAAAHVMATTIAFAIVPVYAGSDGVRTCTVLPVGDTSVWVLRSSGTWDSVTDIKNEGNAVAGSATAALPLLPAGPLEARTTELGEGDALFVLTDGVGDPLGDGTGEVGRALSEAWRRPPDRYLFAGQVDFRRRSHTDDRTVIGIWPDQLPAEPTTDPLTPPTTSTTPPVSSLTTPSFAEPSASTAGPATSDVAPVTSDELGPTSSTTPDGGGTDDDTGGSWTPTPWTPTEWKPT